MFRDYSSHDADSPESHVGQRTSSILEPGPPVDQPALLEATKDKPSLRADSTDRTFLDWMATIDRPLAENHPPLPYDPAIDREPGEEP